ncbi:hypothetical protein G6011_06494 [Alternaria panax]|uniref:Azaphilone pigments biosynthesis cluster protein L N-terminal domain-containing protein n=1 Tax=Alternaria panax TaxID=48097 RepID=A0AAD4I9E1_9PLEO|nr:hypothetical protein G6011_06494 [Alternaria panax]
MADPLSIIASAITVGASAAQLSLALFSVVQTLRNAPREIAEIAEEISLLAESLQTLADIIRAHQNLCKPALFKNTDAIILRCKQVDAEIKKLIDTPQKLAGLKWLINKPKAKGLLKKVEGIKTALILELNIVRLAREEIIRLPEYSESDLEPQIQSISKSNRFRKIVESAVQANRQVVESAQQEEDDSEASKRHYTTAEIDVWKEGSFDTATWLYHFVFSSDDANSSPVPNPRTRRLHQASVTDESAEIAATSAYSSSSGSDTKPSRRSSGPEEKTMIAWSRQTEPALVVDRLLSSWTTLTSDQITLSSTRHEGDGWREGVLRMVEEAKKEDELSFDQWEQQNEPVRSDDEEFQSAEEDSTVGVNVPTYNFRNNTHNARKRNARTSNRADRWADTDIYSPTYIDGRSKGNVKWQETTPAMRQRTPHPSKQMRDTEKPRTVDDEVSRPTSRVHTIHSDQTDSAFGPPNDDFNYDKITSSYLSPYVPGYNPPPISYGFMPPWRNPTEGFPVPPSHQGPPRQSYTSADRHWSYSSPPPSPPPAIAPSPPPFLPNPARDIQSTAPGTEAKENAVLTAVEKLLERRNQESKAEYEHLPFSKLAQIMQEREVKDERERANATTELYIKQMQEAREKDEKRMQGLESRIADQIAEHKRMEIMWVEERKTLEATLVKQAQEVRELAAKEIAAAQLAKEAAQIALNVEKLEAEKEARKRADSRVVEERKRSEESHKLQLQRYEELLRGIQEPQQRSEQDNDRPVRRTRIAEGNCSVDVTEYLTSKQVSPLTSSPLSPHDSFARLDMRSDKVNDHYWPHRRSRRDSYRSSTASLQSSRTSLGNTGTSDTDSTSQQMIVFPIKADRRSQKTAELQTSLARFGIDSAFEDPKESRPLHFGQLIPYKYEDMSDQIVRSTIFWEASMLSLGSELLMTMKQAGWRPTYTRISGKGQTHYLGEQPVHTYFFSPDYKPQFCPPTKASANESITIQRALVEEYALIELGFGFNIHEAGTYTLDGRLTYSDIETLIERSFLMRENNHRRLHRQLQWHYDKSPQVPLSSYPETHAPSLYSASSVYSGSECTTCEDPDTEAQDKRSSAASDADQSDVDDINNFLTPRSAKSRRSVTPSSVASRTSKSTNPWRKYMKVTENTGNDDASRSSGSPNLID